MKTLKYIALSLLAAACTTACKDDPELLTTDVGPEMTAVSSDASGVFGGKVGFAPKGCVEQKGIGSTVSVQFQHPAAKGYIGGSTLRGIQRLAGGAAGGTLRLFFLGNGHTKHLASPVGEDT